MAIVKLHGLQSTPNSSTNSLKHSVVSEPLSKNAYVSTCLLPPAALTLTGTTLKHTLSRLVWTAPTRPVSLEVAEVEELEMRVVVVRSGAVALPEVELARLSTAGSRASVSLCGTSEGVVVSLSGGWRKVLCLRPHPGSLHVKPFRHDLEKCPPPRQLPHNLFCLMMRSLS